MNFLAELRTRLGTALQGMTADPQPFVEMLRPTQDAKFGDFQANCAMSLGKLLGKSPRDVATEIVERWQIADLCTTPEIAGPGFINLRLRDDRLTAATQQLMGDDRCGVAPVAQPRKVVIDFSGPNVAKPMHVGHLRSTVIGAALDRLLRFAGHHVTSDNHVGDWGTQFGMIIYGYKHFCDRAAYNRDPVPELARLYRLVNQLSDYHELQANLPKLQAQVTAAVQLAEQAKHAAQAAPQHKELAKAAKKAEGDVAAAREDVTAANKKIAAIQADADLLAKANAHPQIAVSARQETAKLHAGDTENNALWNQFLPQCLAALEHMYQRMQIAFDVTLGESHYNPQLPGVVQKLKDRGLARVSDGAVCVFIEGNAAPFIVQKGDGAFTYATTDLATIDDRVATRQADTILYVVDDRQSEHFELLFATARLLGHDQLDLRHIKFGTVLGEDRRPYKTRSGDTIGLESLLDEAISKSQQIVDANETSTLTAQQRAEVAEIVGLGAVFYADLRHNRESDYVFSWDKMLATTGDTATYMQYAYARVHGICRKGGLTAEQVRDAGGEIVLTAPAERRLALQLNRLSEAIHDVLIDYRPHVLTQYLYETANLFSEFYDQCPVLKEEVPSATRRSRLLLCDLTARVLRLGLQLLGIRVVTQM